MSTITTRAGKGSALTNAELDANFTNLNTDKAETASPTFTGTPAAPTAVAGTNTTQLATTAFVQGKTATQTPFTATGNIAATNVQAALNELDTEKFPTAGGTFTGQTWGAQGNAFNVWLTGSGSNAPGVLVYKPDKTTLAGGAGVFGDAGVPSYAYLGCSTTPWASGISVNTSGQASQSGAQLSAINALTRKDYVDGQDALKVAKAGDTMTGNLTLTGARFTGSAGARIESAGDHGLLIQGLNKGLASVGIINDANTSWVASFGLSGGIETKFYGAVHGFDFYHSSSGNASYQTKFNTSFGETARIWAEHQPGAYTQMVLSTNQGPNYWQFRNDGNAYGNQWLGGSDSRVKKERQVIEGALGKVGQLIGYTYVRADINDYYGNPTTVRTAGLLAQDVEKVIPECVSATNPIDDKFKVPGDEGNFRHLDYNGVLALLVNAINELKTEFYEYKTAHP